MSNYLQDFQNLVREDLASVVSFIKNSKISNVEFIPLIIKYLVECGGKRIRPCLTLAFCKLLGYSKEDKIKVSSAIEFIHSATLLHDDVVDNSDVRRNYATVKSVWGNKKSILVGDFLLGMAFNWIVDTDNIDLLKSVSKASITLAEGEIKQLLNVKNIEIECKDYIEIITCKTAVLFSTACEAGAILADAYIKEARNFGENLGKAYQITDDVLDYEGEKTGKFVGNDFYSGKVTLPVILAYGDATTEEKKFWERCMSKMEQEKGDFQKAIGYLEKHNAIERCLDMARGYLKSAKNELEGIKGDQESKRSILGMLKFIAEREH